MPHRLSSGPEQDHAALPRGRSWLAWWARLTGERVMWGLVLAFAWLAATAWLRPLTLPDEGRYVGVALEMLHSGDWGTPTLAGLPFFHKPPLFYWVTASAMSLFGVHEWAARLASLLAATVGAGAILLLARRWAGAAVARLVLPVLLTQPLWFMGAQFANMDMLVAACITCTITLGAHAALQLQAGRRWRAALLAAYAMAALGVLAKGLIGAVIPALVLFSWLAVQGQWRHIALLLWPPGLVAFVLVVTPWFMQMQRLYPDFMHYFFVVQHFERYTQGGFNNAEPFWFYPVVLALLSLPWVAWLAVSLRRGGWRRVRQQPLILLMWVWLAVVVGFFSLPHSKLLGYVLPAVPPLALLIADAASSLRRSHLRATGGLAAVLCVGLVVVVAVCQPQSSKPLAKAWSAQRQAGETLVFIEDYYYDFSFYAHTGPPDSVVDTWGEHDVLQHDNWRRELAESAAFASASTRLVRGAELPRQLCSQRVSWVLAPEGSAGRFPFLALTPPVASAHGGSLWRVDSRQPAMASSLRCR